MLNNFVASEDITLCISQGFTVLLSNNLYDFVLIKIIRHHMKILLMADLEAILVTIQSDHLPDES